MVYLNITKRYAKTGAQQGGEGQRPPLPFFENQNKCPHFGKKDPDCVHPLG